MTSRRDDLGAFCTHAAVARPGASAGPLARQTFAAKDVFTVAGQRACFGCPDWLATHGPAAATATAITRLLDAGAALVGMTVTDELAFSLTGENEHYGTPINPAAPGRVPGGSSSGSAAAVAGGLVDFALGTDTGGSVRVPASHCGLFGFRPTHGAVDSMGVLPFSPRFDTVGWLARDATTLAAVGDVLLRSDRADEPGPAGPLLLLAQDAFELLDVDARASLLEAARECLRELPPLTPAALGSDHTGPLAPWLSTYATLQNADVARTHRAWIARTRPRFGGLIGKRMAAALAVTTQAKLEAEQRLGALRAHLAGLLEGGGVLIMPSAAGVAPLRGQPHAVIDAETARSLTLGAVASLGGLPQVSLPICRVGGLPLGVSLLAAPGRDRALLALAAQLCR